MVLECGANEEVSSEELCTTTEEPVKTTEECDDVKNHLVKAQPADEPGSVILAKEPVLQANFARAVSSLSKAQAKKVARFLPNPERHWGPKLRAGRQITSKHVSLLGQGGVNGVLNQEENIESKSKMQKTQDNTTA